MTGSTLTRHMYLGGRLIADSPVTAPSGLASLPESERSILLARALRDAVATQPGLYPVVALDGMAAVAVGSGVLVLCVGLAFAPGRVRIAYLGKVHRGRVAVIVLVFAMATSPLPLVRPAWGVGGGSPPPPPTYPVYFMHADHLGSTVMLTCYKQSSCSDGAVARYYRYDAYGQPKAYSATGTAISSLGTALSTGYIPERLYTGQRWDWQARLYYYGARFYDPKIANFLSEDPARQGASPYAYVGWNPVRHTDPTGRFFGLGSDILTVTNVALATMANVQTQAYAMLLAARGLGGDGGTRGPVPHGGNMFSFSQSSSSGQAIMMTTALVKLAGGSAGGAFQAALAEALGGGVDADINIGAATNGSNGMTISVDAISQGAVQGFAVSTGPEISAAATLSGTGATVGSVGATGLGGIAGALGEAFEPASMSQVGPMIGEAGRAITFVAGGESIEVGGILAGTAAGLLRSPMPGTSFAFAATGTAAFVSLSIGGYLVVVAVGGKPAY